MESLYLEHNNGNEIDPQNVCEPQPIKIIALRKLATIKVSKFSEVRVTLAYDDQFNLRVLNQPSEKVLADHVHPQFKNEPEIRRYIQSRWGEATTVDKVWDLQWLADANKINKMVAQEFIMMLSGLNFYSNCLAYQYKLAKVLAHGHLDKYCLPDNLRFEFPKPEQKTTIVKVGCQNPVEDAAFILFEDSSLYIPVNFYGEGDVWESAEMYCQRHFKADQDLTRPELELCQLVGWEL